ncbi:MULTISPECIES: aminopeptidase P family protein [unclassified Sphingomonas]|uniref:aminopeptidase P family protein n=1 Tax=unclassified Sphingomonas TaxID=196159 RepID=UPI002150F345|nr:MULTISPECIES: aminopeptidase P family protein [unclassified Sphingomonas]MCR5870178.1 aminopeptidase P family protein [Sphingomonas sp. J344]UUX98131.1 aminopeptidase P family protein [Sphingomonas sp. J315]
MSTHAARLQALRDQLQRDQLDGFVVPLTDEHMSEYVGAYAQRLAWLTGFQGSAGSAVVLPEAAAIFTDGRYTIQVRQQVDGTHWDYVPVPQVSIADWLRDHAPQGGRIGYDPWLHTRGWVEEARKALAERGAELVAVSRNPIDAVWDDQPAPSDAKLAVQSDDAAGRTSASKRAEIADWLAERKADAVVLSALDSIAWVFNVRGADVSHTPVALAYAIVNADGTADLFVAKDKVGDDVAQHLGNAVRLHDRGAFAPALKQFAGKRVAADPMGSVAAIFDALDAGGATILATRDPVVLAKAIKNDAEISGHKAAQARDGAALARFLKWAEAEMPKGGVTEMSAAERLQAFREETGVLRDLSFDTISGTGPNGAIPHYKVTEESSLPIEQGHLYLVDSGGQYEDGTTDVTRVIPVGEPTQEMRDRFTRVLKGHIAIATAVFPEGTTGGQIDAFARRPLWEVGCDYGHGTGHGVGAYLSVHEGPQRIAAPNYPGGGPAEPLRAGMFLSNEPGYYKAGEFGIRIENLVLVVEKDIPGAESVMLGFETLTFAPIERTLIEPGLLTEEERRWLDAYHARVLEILGPQLSPDERAWLEGKCRPIAAR